MANNGGANSTAVSEHALLLMLASSRKLVWQHHNVAAGNWRGNQTHVFELSGKRLVSWDLHNRQEDGQACERVWHAGYLLRHRTFGRT